MREAESRRAENIGLKDIARSRRGELISRGELIMYYRTPYSVRMRENPGKMRTRIYPNTDSFYAVKTF